MSAKPQPTVLLVDVGNTSITLGLARGGRVRETGRLPTRECSERTLLGACRAAARGSRPDGVMVSSVVPRVDAVCARAARRAFGCRALFLRHTLALGVGVDYPRPETIGADRLANAAGAAERFGCPVIVADFGTALTFDIVSGAGDYVGGVIAPGLPLMADYFAERTALLPHVDLRGGRAAIGRSTVAAMRLGARLGYRGMVREITVHLLDRVGADASLCATGGYARWVVRGLDPPYVVDPALTLKGMYRIYRLNQEGAER